MSLRSKILHHALPLLPAHSFTRQTLSLALSSLPTSHPDHRPDPTAEGVIDTLFGEGITAPGQALVEAWDEQGRARMEAVDAKGGVRGMLRDRLGYSAGVGEHLVEAYALLSSPSSPSSLHIPSIPNSTFTSLQNLRVPPLYTPPTPPSPSSSPNPDLSPSPSPLLSESSHYLPLLSLNPLGPMTYAWRIADTALALSEKHRGLRKGMMNEPVGAGPEWYTSRFGVSLAYLAAESHLLQPYPTSSGEIMDEPNLPAAQEALELHLARHESMSNLVEGGGQGMENAMHYLRFFGKSWAGLIRSRGW